MANIYELSTTAASNASAGGMNWAEGQAPSTVNNSARQLSALIAQFLDDIGGDLEAGGTANALTLTANSDFTAYADGRMVAFKASADNTAAATLSVNGIGAKAIRKMTSAGEAGLDAADLKNGYTYVVRYSETANSAAGAWLVDWSPKADPLTREEVGVIKIYAGTTAPSGYIFPYGQAISRTTYSALFTALGTTYGVGDGSTTFNVPDLRGRSPFGKDDMGGTSANRITDQTGGWNGDTLGDTGGSETVTLTEAQMPTHLHGAGTLATDTAPAHVHTLNGREQTDGGSNDLTRVSASETGATIVSITSAAMDAAGAHDHDVTGNTANAGSGNAHNNLPPGIVVNFILFTGVA